MLGRAVPRARSLRVDRGPQGADVVAQRGRPLLRDLHGAAADDDAVRVRRRLRSLLGRRDPEAEEERDVGDLAGALDEVGGLGESASRGPVVPVRETR